MEKVYIDKELWYIENFLTEKEIELIMKEANQKDGWYKFPNSPAIRNRFLTLNIPTHPEGTICSKTGSNISGDIIALPDEKNQYWTRYNRKDNEELVSLVLGLGNRLGQVLPDNVRGFMALQSFWPIENGSKSRGVLDWHYEKGYPGAPDSTLSGSWTLYLNDDFEGGVLEFLYKPYMLKPKKGMLVSTPLTKEWSHRVSPVISGVRHTFHGECRTSEEYVDLYENVKQGFGLSENIKK